MPSFYDLERHRATHGLILLRHVNQAHASLANLLKQLVPTNPVSDLFKRG
jgi:hypothetical protein